MHGYGATTFGRLVRAGGWAFPSILHEHANHGDTPWFQKVADRLLAPHTDLAIAVSESTAEFTIRARLMPAERTKVVYLGAPLDEFARARGPEEIAAARAALGIAPDTIAVGTVTRLMPSKGNEYLVGRRAGDRCSATRARASSSSARASCRRRSRQQAQRARTSAIASSSSASSATSRPCCPRSTWSCSRRSGRARR